VAFTLGFYGGHDGTRTRDLYRVICIKTLILLGFARFRLIFGAAKPLLDGLPETYRFTMFHAAHTANLYSQGRCFVKNA
jgi:hypothetical protein